MRPPSVKRTFEEVLSGIEPAEVQYIMAYGNESQAPAGTQDFYVNMPD